MRLRAGKTLEDAAQAAGVTASTLSRWERSEVWPDATCLHALCFAFNASEEEVAALTCAEGLSALLPQTNDLEQMYSLGWGLYNRYQHPLASLLFLGLEAQAWRLLPQQPEAQTILFVLYYWQMKASVNMERREQALPYTQRVLRLAETMPRQIKVAHAEAGTVVLEAGEAASRAVLYQAMLAGRNRPTSLQTSARRLARSWGSAHNAYFRAWMMSEAAKLLMNTGERDMALDWSRQA